MTSFNRRSTLACLCKFSFSAVVFDHLHISPFLPFNSVLTISLAPLFCSYEARKLEFEKRRFELRELYRIWDVESDDTKGYYVPKQLLVRVLEMNAGLDDAKEATEPPAPDQIACKHGKLCPKAVVRSKRVSEVYLRFAMASEYSLLLNLTRYCSIFILSSFVFSHSGGVQYPDQDGRSGPIPDFDHG